MDMEGLSVICAGIGLADEDEIGNRIGYSTGEYCLDNLKDLLRFLRRDDPKTREVFKQVCKWNIVSKDLIPIFEYCQDDRNLVLNAVKVLVFLTMPIEPSSNDIPEQIEYLWGLKSAITCSDTVAVIVSLLEGPLENLECEAFTEDDWKLVQLVLTFFRNILAIQDIPPHQKAGGSASEFVSLRDKFVELLFNENVMDIIIVIAQHVGGSRGHFRHDNLLLLETFYYIFMGQDPELIAKVHQKGSKKGGDNKDSLDSLKSLMAKEEEKRKISRLENAIRHSQFSGTFARPTMDGSKAVFKGNPNRASHNIILKPHKGHKGVNKRIVWDIGGLPSTKDNDLELLHDFVNQFLSGSYNVLMQSIRKDIEKEHHAIQNSDIIIFFRVAQFVTSFQYHKILSSKPTKETDTSEASADEFADSTLFKGNICGPIASSMDDSMFQLVISKWRYAFDGLKETKEYKFLSAAGSLMKNLICMLDLVLKLLPEDSKEPQTTRILLYKLFYDQTDQGVTQFLLNLIKAFDTHKQPKSDLADLVEMICVLVRLMEKLQARGTLRVSKKSRRGRKKEVVKIEKEVLNGEKEVQNGEKEAESEGKKKVLKGEKEAENEVSGSNATIQDDICISNSEHIEDFCMLQKENPTNTTSDGNEDMTIPAQIDEPEKLAPDSGDLGVNLPQMDERKSDHMDDYLNCSSGDSGDEQPAATEEVDFRVSTFISAFANCSIIQKLCWLLNFYKSNSNRTNHYIICMLRTITDDLELAPMLYQLSLLTTFYDILAEQKSCPCKDYENIVDFLKSLVRKMFKRMKNQPLLFVEILFWKTCRECHYINAEYMLQELGNVKKRTGNWENVSEIGEIGSSQAKGWSRRSLADALGEDEADVVISHDLGYQNELQEDIPSGLNSETDRGISSMQGEFDKVPKRKRRLVLSNEWDKKIKDLYDKFKDDQNCSRLIAESLDPDGKVSAAQVSNKLKQLGFQLAPKKRVRSTAESRSAGPDQPGEEQVTMKSKSVLLNSDDLEGSLLSQPLNKRKRVHAFSRDQEAMIKVLYEQFKDHKKCSYMIANALDDGNTFTAAQISRKLKQLGLHTPKQKRSKAHMNLRDEEPADTAIDEAHDSDNKTLLSFRKRKKSKDDGGLFDKGSQQKNIQGKMSDDSDEETLSSVLKKKSKDDGGLFDKEPQQKNIQGQKSDDSDEETLSIVLKKSRKLHPESEDKRLGTTLAKGTIEDSRNVITEDVTERNGDSQSSEEAAAGTDKDITFNQFNPDVDTSETELTINNVDDLPNQLMDDKDLEDDLAPDESTRSVVSRRKLRMVIDADDDDD
ncbi:hypothetical protein Ddye_013884 [Dipteronia dyeriana]|uniref:Timeless N-terminal domain-containing protein n=1 Tax=Dipteronia dyeriana TaxID=168575 RepID=A0AAE0CKM0_9ROSI|nr:hypothetical protein Ddye_013884 [Dipteronia dyeriana]